MKLQSKITFLRAKASPGFTLVELLVSATISVFVVGSIAMLCVISAQNYAATVNYAQMNEKSRIAMDLISREIRNASSLVNYTSQSLQLENTNIFPSTTTTITYANNSIILGKTGQPDQTLLTGCYSFSFQLFGHQPSATKVSYTNVTTSAQACKVINLTWSCSRPIAGSKLSTEVVQTAQVMLRSKQ